MAEKRTTGGGYLRKSSSGMLKRSSSVEILMGLTTPSATIVAPASENTSKQPLTDGSKGPAEEEPKATPQQKSTAKSTEALPQAPPNSLHSSSSTPSINTVLSTPQSDGGLSPNRSLSSGVLHNTRGPIKTSTPLRAKPSKVTSAGMPSPVTKVKSSAVPTPIFGERGHIFNVTTEPPDEALTKVPAQKSEGAEVNPLAQRRKRKDTVTSQPTQGEDEPEPVWQKRLSLLFVKPSEQELQKEGEEPQSPISTEPEETKKLIPGFSPKIKKRSQDENQNVAILNELYKGATGEKYNNNNNKNNRKRLEDGEGEGEEEESVVKSNNRIIFHEDVLQKKQNGRDDDEDRDRLSLLDELERKEDDSDEFGTTSEEEDEEDVFRDGYTSWDDTICSNRSAYFKMYYSQRGVIGPNRSDEKAKASRASSQNSLSSLIRERMGRPQLPTSKKSRADLGLMILVAVLFVVIVVGISLTSYFYNLHLMEMTIFNSIKFFEKSRILEIYNPRWEPVATAHLGQLLPPESIPEDCTHYLHYLHKHNHTMPNDVHDHAKYEDFVCLDWTSLARLQLRKLRAAGDIQCYSVWWVSAQQDYSLRDCLQVGGEYGAWWGGGEMSDGGYPVTKANVPPSHMVTGKLGINAWGQLLRRAWLSDRASLMTLPDSFQGFVSVNHNGDGQVCIESRPHPHLKSRTPTLEYTLCTAPNISTLARYMHQKAIGGRKIVVEYNKNNVNHTLDNEELIGLNDSTDDEMHFDSHHELSEVFGEEIVNRVKERIDQPVWIPWMPPNQPELTQDSVLKYVENIVTHDYGNWGHILLPPSWQARPGELTFDPKRFPDPSSMVDILEKKGFRLALSIHPFVSVNAPAFNNGTYAGLWVRQSKSELPALAQYNDVHPAVVTDFSNPKAKEWFSSRLKILQDTYKIDRFHLQPADAHALPAFHEYHLPLPGPDSVLVHFMASVSTISLPMSSEGAVGPPLPPTFLTLGHADGSWQGLETLIPRILTLATLGCPLIDIGVIGGISEAGQVPERELYMRWMEAAAFLPAVQVSVLPHMYGEQMKSLTVEYNKLRRDLVLPRLHEKIPDALKNGTPLITPLALFSPKDPEAAQVDDQWILGRDLLVAPVTRRGKRSRDIYLPEGIWEDGLDKHLRKGGRWIMNYKVPTTKIPHFILKSTEDFNNS